MQKRGLSVLDLWETIAVVCDPVWDIEAVGATKTLILRCKSAFSRQFVSSITENENGSEGAHHHDEVASARVADHTIADPVKS